MSSPARCSWLLLAMAGLAACSIEGRSGDFACEGAADCGDGRSCQNGWCVLPGGGADDGGLIPQVDAGSGGGDATPGVDAAAAVCSDAICDYCDNGTCVFFCTAGGSCPAGVECPPGLPCRVVCSGVDSCAGGVDCTAASQCTIQCTKNGACAGPVECGGGPCDVSCSAREACIAGVDCSDSCACTTSCSGADACGIGPECPLATCVDGDGDCISGADCDVCGG